MSNGKAVLYFGGIPTEPDIKRIRDKWPDADLQPGQEIPCEDVAAVFGEKVDTDRFQTVTGRWRRLVEKGPAGLVIAKRKENFVVLRDGEVVNRNESDLRSVVKRTRRVAIRSSNVDVTKLSEDERKRYDLHVGMSNKLILAANMRKLSAPPAKLE